ncbi:hypothetical protein SK128_017095, partial [Halocaridina rubra]
MDGRRFMIGGKSYRGAVSGSPVRRDTVEECFLAPEGCCFIHVGAPLALAPDRGISAAKKHTQIVGT